MFVDAVPGHLVELGCQPGVLAVRSRQTLWCLVRRLRRRVWSGVVWGRRRKVLSWERGERVVGEV